ncbi:MAG: hypothetical protein WBH44_05660, partial [Proteocatella sp.]
EYLDGLMYEDLTYKEVETLKYYKNLVDRIAKTAADHEVIILAVSHEDALKNYELAQELNWLYYVSIPGNNYLNFDDHMYNINLK